MKNICYVVAGLSFKNFIEFISSVDAPKAGSKEVERILIPYWSNFAVTSKFRLLDLVTSPGYNL